MASRPSSPTETSQGERDILTSVLPEILIKIIAQLPSKCYLDLVHTSKTLRNFVKINASRICNEAIRTRFPLEAAVLKSKLSSGWLVLGHEAFREREDAYCKDFASRNSTDHHRYRDGEMNCSLLGVLQPTTTSSIKLGAAGPQFLYFLEQDLILIGVGPFEQLGRGWMFWPGCKPNKVEVNGQTYYIDLLERIPPSNTRFNNTFQFSIVSPIGNALPSGIASQLVDAIRFGNALFSFMEKVNGVTLHVKNGKLVPPPEKRGGFPRELVWFYGVERLSIVEKGVEEDWKKLPMLLWD